MVTLYILKLNMLSPKCASLTHQAQSKAAAPLLEIFAVAPSDAAAATATAAISFPVLLLLIAQDPLQVRDVGRRQPKTKSSQILDIIHPNLPRLVQAWCWELEEFTVPSVHQ